MIIRHYTDDNFLYEKRYLYDEQSYLFFSNDTCFINPYLRFYDVKLKEKVNVNRYVDKIINKLDQYVIGYYDRDYVYFASFGSLFLPITTIAIEKNKSPNTSLRHDLLTNSISSVKNMKLPLKVGAVFINIPHIMFEQINTGEIHGLYYFGNLIEAFKKVKLNVVIDPVSNYIMPVEYDHVKDVSMKAMNHIDFFTGSNGIAIFTRDKFFDDSMDPISDMLWPMFPLSAPLLMGVLMNIAITNMLLASIPIINTNSGFIGFSKDTVIKFVKIKGYEIFGQFIQDEENFIMYSVPLQDKNFRRNNTIAESYIYNHFDGINIFTPKFTSNLSYLFLDNLSYIQKEKLKHVKEGRSIHADYLDPNPSSIKEPDKEKWRLHLEDLIYQNPALCKLILFEKNGDNSFVQYLEYEPIKNSYFKSQKLSKFQPKQLFLGIDHNNVPISFYSQIYPVSIGSIESYMPEVANLKEGETIAKRIKISNVSKVFTVKNLILLLTVEDKDLFISTMMPDFIPIKKGNTFINDVFLITFNITDGYKYKKNDQLFQDRQSISRYLLEKCKEHIKNLDISMNLQEKDLLSNIKKFEDYVFNQIQSSDTKFNLYLYTLDVDVDGSFDISVTVTKTKSGLDITITKIVPIEIKSITYKKNTNNTLSNNTNNHIQNYVNAITLSSDIIKPQVKINMPAIYSIPEWNINHLVRNKNEDYLEIQLLLAYKLINFKYNHQRNQLIVDNVKMPDSVFKMLRKYSLMQTKKSNIKIQDIYPFKWILSSKNKSKLFK